MSKARGLAALGNAYNDGALSNRNLIINGELIVNQRSNVSGGNVGNGTYTYDRWATVQTLATNTSDGGGYQNSPSIRMDATATASAQMALEQRIEGPANFDGLVVTVSAWVKSNSSNCRINIYDSGWNGIKSTAHTGGGAWEFLTATGTYSTNMTDLRVRIGLSDQGNTSITNGDYFEFAQCQLERGDTATPFEHRSYGDELQRCQRYYQILMGKGHNYHAEAMWVVNSSGTDLSMAMMFPHEMRAAPTGTRVGGLANVSSGSVGVSSWAIYNSGVWKGCTDLSMANISPTSCRIDASPFNACNVGGAAGLYGGEDCYWTLDAEL